MLLEAALLLPLLAPAAAPQKRLIRNDFDRVVLNGGKELEARVIYEDEQVVVVREGGKKARELARAEVAELRSVEANQRTFLERVDAITDPGDVAAVLDVGRYCKENGLPGEARLCWLYVITKDPENQAAWTELGGREGRSGWELNDDKKWRTLDEFREFHSEWKNALELRSTHFVLQSDRPLEDCIRTLVTLEEFYVEFYGALTPQIRLHAFDAMPLVQITKDRKHYPAPPVPQDAWFSALTNTLNVCAEGTIDTRLIVREFTVGMIYGAFFNTVGKDGRVEPWIGVGLAEWFAGALREGELRLAMDLEEPVQELFRRHAQAAEPIPLERLLRFSYMELRTPPMDELGAAEAYTLLYFLARGADRKYRDGLLEFVFQSYAGKGGASNFKRTVAKDLDALEAEWTAFAKQQAGG